MVAYSFKTQFVNPIRVGFGLPPLMQIGKHEVAEMEAPVGPKRQTIRAFGKRRHARPGETVSAYWGMRTKGCFLIGVGRCVSLEGVLLKWSEWPAFYTFDVMEWEPGAWRRVGDLRSIADVDAFARDDGFAGAADMERFWREEHGGATFEGALVKWGPSA